AIEIAIRCLHQAVQRKGAVKTTGEGMEECQGAEGSHPEERSIAVGASLKGGAVEVAVGSLHQTAVRIGAVDAIGEVVKGVQPAVEGHPENRAIELGAAARASAVQIAIFALHQARVRERADAAACEQ